MDADVIVIGAGAAGLGAARKLAGRSIRVVLLEARERVAGRVWSRRIASMPTFAELGAEFVHGRAEQTMALIREVGMETAAADGERWIRKNGDLRIANNDFTSAAAIFKGAAALSRDESVDRFLRRFDGNGTMRETVEMARTFVEGFDAADPAIASARAIAQEWGSGVDTTSARPIGTYQPIFQHLQRVCDAMGVAMCLSTVVRRISWHRDGVEVSATNDRGESRTIESRAAIITLPVGVLRHGGDETVVEFDPDLPLDKRKALGSIEMGHVVKVALWFRAPFWERVRNGRYYNAAFFRGKGQPFATYWTQLPERSRLIVAWVGGPKARALGGVAETHLIEQAVNGFGSLLGAPEGARQEFEAGAVHDWDRDPFARGAYSYVAVGGADARVTLAAPVDDTLFFAGEATSNDGQGGTVNGALETGERAAAQVANAFGVRRD
ncbi:MAG TPA: NAD(P)/FAD-dependent oxidoreductase [Candidatus Cybelea sp.]